MDHFKEPYPTQFWSGLDDSFFNLGLITCSWRPVCQKRGPVMNASSNNTRSVPPEVIFPYSPLPTLTLGDLNIHHPTADTRRVFQEDEIASSTSYFDWATDLGFSLLNTPGMFTRFCMSLIGRPGVLDLAFACPLLAPHFTEW